MPLTPLEKELLEACRQALAVESQIGEHDTIIGRNERMIERLQSAIARAERADARPDSLIDHSGRG